MERRIYQIVLPLRRRMTTAATSIDTRSVIVVSMGSKRAGWGEAAPIAGGTPDDFDTVWNDLVQWVDGAGSDHLGSTAAAAVDEATHDRDARRAGVPLWRKVGGSRRDVPTGVAIGLDTLDEQLRAIADAASIGVARIKLKIRPGSGPDPIREIHTAFPDLAVAVDGNQSYRTSEIAELRAIDTAGVSYIEQPLAVHDLEGHAQLREQLTAPICLDEAIDSAAAVAAVAASGAADIVTLKPGRLGMSGAVDAYVAARSAGLRVKVSGLFESAIGRAFVAALGSLDGVGEFDLAPNGYYFTDDLAPDHRTGAFVALTDAAGIGVAPTPEELDRLAVRQYPA